jgi:PAS domain S-box-containing protein
VSFVSALCVVLTLCSTSNTKSKSSVGGVQVKVTVEDGKGFTLGLKPEAEVSFNKVSRKVEAKVGYLPNIRAMVGKELVPLEEQAEWAPIWTQFKANKGGELVVRKRDVNELNRNERTMLESLVDGCVVATTSMTILYVNKQLLKMTGFTLQEVVGRNVQMLMPTEVAKNHEGYVNAYLGTGQAKVIGKGRQVQLQRKDKSLATCWLSITEQKKASGRHTFLGMLHEVQSKMRSENLTNFTVLDAVQKVVLVIDSNGVLKFLNRHAEKLLGYGEEAVGMNVSSLMPQPYSGQHASYLLNYMKSGNPKIIGKGVRTVLAQRKDGSVVAVDLAVEEISLGGARHFVGIMREASTDQQEQRSVLQETRGVVNSLAVPAVVIDKNGRIQAFNAFAETLLGYSMVDVLGEKVQCLMNSEDATRHDSYLANYLRSNVAKVIGSTRLVLAKTVDGNLLPVNLSVSKTVNPDNADDILFTGLLVPSAVGLKGETSTESTNYGANERKYKQMNSLGENTVKTCAAVKDFGFAEDPNPAHRPSMEDAWIMMDDFGGVDNSAFFGLYDGHGGAEAAEFAAAKLHLFLMKLLRDGNVSLTKAMEAAYLQTHEAMGSEIAKAGCTAVTVLLQKNGPLRSLVAANAGDSRAVLVRDGGPLRLTKDHKPSDPEEKALSEQRFCLRASYCVC